MPTRDARSAQGPRARHRLVQGRERLFRLATTVQVGSERRLVIAREATDEERARLWPRLVDMYPDYDAYHRRTERKIPVVILNPAT